MSTEVHVDVFTSSLRPVGDRRGLFDPIERDRLANISRRHGRDLYATAHLLLRTAVTFTTGIPAREQRFDRLCRSCLAQHGSTRLLPPVGSAMLDDAPAVTPNISLAYSNERAVVAICSATQVGVDIEHWSTTDFAGFSAIALTPDEALELLDFSPLDAPWAKATWWARKESLFKATGYWLFVDGSTVRVTPPDSPPELVEWGDDLPEPQVRMADIPVPGRYACGLAVTGTIRPRVRLIDATGDVAALAATAG